MYKILYESMLNLLLKYRVFGVHEDHMFGAYCPAPLPCLMLYEVMLTIIKPNGC